MSFILCEGCSLNTQIPATRPRGGQGKYLLKGISQGSLLAILRHKYALIHEQIHYVARWLKWLLKGATGRGHSWFFVACVIHQINTYLSSSKQARISQ